MGLHGRCMPPTACPFTAWVTGSQKPVRSRRPLRGGKKGRRASVRLVFQNDPGCQFHVLRQQCDSALRVTCDGGLDRKSTRLNPVTNAHLVCRLLLEKKKKHY